jgi:SAM-dependent methyltransferase
VTVPVVEALIVKPLPGFGELFRLLSYRDVNEPTHEEGTIWANEEEARLLRRRAFHFWNADYLERVVLPILEPPEGSHVLDVGSGYGGLTLPLARAQPDLQITGLDARSEGRRRGGGARPRPRRFGRAVRGGRRERLAFCGFELRLVCCQTLLTHFPEPERELAEMVHVLKSSGCLFAVEYHHLGAFSAFETREYRGCGGALERFRSPVLYMRGQKAPGRATTPSASGTLRGAGYGFGGLGRAQKRRAWHAFPPYRKENENVGSPSCVTF